MAVDTSTLWVEGFHFQNLFFVSSFLFFAYFGGDFCLAQQWPIRVGGVSSDFGQAVALDAAETNVYVTGKFSDGPIDFNPGSGTNNLTAAGFTDMYVAKYATANSAYQWAFRVGASGQDCKGLGIASDASDNVYVTGNFSGTINFNPSGTNNLVAAGADMFVAKYNSANVYQWAFRVGAAGVGMEGDRICVDGSGNAYVIGFFRGTVDFNPSGGGTLVSNGGTDVFVVKYSSAGVYQWAFNIGAGSDDYGYDIAVDGSSNVYVCGYFTGTTDFDPVGTYNLISQGGSVDGFVAKYNSASAFQWAFRIGETNGTCSGAPGGDICTALTVDAGSDVYVSGTFWNEIDANPGAGADCLYCSGCTSFFVAKYNSSGIYQWAFPLYDIGGYSNGMDVTSSVGSNVYVTGIFSSPSDFDPGGGTTPQMVPYSGSDLDIFVAEYTSAGAYVCAFRLGKDLSDAGRDIVVDASGKMYIVGDFQRTNVDFNPGAGTVNLTSAGNQDIFVAVYNGACAIVLPVELLYFVPSCLPVPQAGSPDKSAGEIILRWATASETNNDYFTVEKNNGMMEEWNVVGTVKGAGNSSTIRKYEFVDVSPLSFGEGPEVRYYRLKQTDYDGRYEYSPIASVHFPCQDEGITVLPNPSSGIFLVTGLSPNSELSVYNVLGEKVTPRALGVIPNGVRNLTVDLSSQSDGVYFLHIKTEKEIITQKLIIQK